MSYFDYNKFEKNVEYYEILEKLMERWEYEIVEFKEAKGSYDTDKIGRYFSAFSNEANLRQQQYGWLVFGVGEEQKSKIKRSSERHTKKVITACWSVSNMKYPKTRLTV